MQWTIHDIFVHIITGVDLAGNEEFSKRHLVQCFPVQEYILILLIFAHEAFMGNEFVCENVTSSPSQPNDQT